MVYLLTIVPVFERMHQSIGGAGIHTSMLCTIGTMWMPASLDRIYVDCMLLQFGGSGDAFWLIGFELEILDSATGAALDGSDTSAWRRLRQRSAEPSPHTCGVRILSQYSVEKELVVPGPRTQLREAGWTGFSDDCASLPADQLRLGN